MGSCRSMGMTELDSRELSASTAELPEQMLDSLERVILGQRSNLTLILATMLSGGHVLLEDRPGVGKTVLARAIGAMLGVDVNRVQGTPDLLPSDVTGVHVYNPKSGEWSFRAGPIFTSLLLVDELNRATPKSQSALLEAMAEGQVSVDGTTKQLDPNFMVIATQNPRGEVGTHPLGNAQLDRFATSVQLGLPDRESERRVISGNAGAPHLADLAPVANSEQIESLRRRIATLPIHDLVLDYLLDVVESFRSIEGVWLSVRVTQTLLQVARGRAVFEGRPYVIPQDVQAVTPSVLAHRLPSAFDRASILGVLVAVPVPVDAG